MVIRWLLVFLFLFPARLLPAQTTQDTLQLSLRQAEVLLLKNNITLLLQQYGVDSAKAGILTARLWDNPDFSIATSFYNVKTRKFFDLSDDNREISMQLSQLIRTAGKRNKAVRIAQTGAVMSQYQLFDLMRTLKYVLRNDFFNIYYQQQTQKVYDTEIKALQRTVAAYKEEVRKGNIAEKDLLRIQTQLYTLQAELVSLQNTLDDVQSEFKLLIRAHAMTYILPDPPPIAGPLVTGISYEALLDSAYVNRYDLKIAQADVILSHQNLALQKANSIPDLSLQAGYDRLGSFVKDYNSVGVGVSIPLFNRNQGYIRQAQINVKSSEASALGAADLVQCQVANAYLGALRAEKLLNSLDPTFEADQTHLIREVTRNFEQRNLSVLEFTDFYEAFKENIVELNNLRYQRTSQLEQLNFTTGTPIFNK